MKHLIIILSIFFSLNSFAQKQVIGKWLSADKDGITTIFEQGGKYFGKITWLKKPLDEKGTQVTDTKNPDNKLQTQALLGLVILKNFIAHNNEWIEGTVYDPNSGKTYSCNMWITDNNTLKVRGYWGIIHQTEIWTRVK